MENVNIQYQNLIREILDEGFVYTDKSRNTKRKQITHKTLEIDLQNSFPAINTKKLYWKGVVTELLWFLRGDTNIKYLVDNNVNIWNKDAYNWYLKNCIQESDNIKDIITFIDYVKEGIEWDEELKDTEYKLGDLGRVYGAQWRDFRYIANVNMPNFDDSHYVGLDQISNLIKGLKENPMGTKHIVTAWNPAELEDMALPPCHWSFEILVELKSKCDCSESEAIYCNSKCQKYQFTLKWHQRSVDSFLGLSFNIASYALLAHIIGKLTGMIPKALIGDLSNVHLYENSWEASRKLIKNNPTKYELADLSISNEFDNLINSNLTIDQIINDLKIDMFKLNNYESFDSIKVEMLSKENGK